MDDNIHDVGGLASLRGVISSAISHIREASPFSPRQGVPDVGNEVPDSKGSGAVEVGSTGGQGGRLNAGPVTELTNSRTPKDKTPLH
jgi:hypothetical protein